MSSVPDTDGVGDAGDEESEVLEEDRTVGVGDVLGEDTGAGALMVKNPE